MKPQSDVLITTNPNYAGCSQLPPYRPSYSDRKLYSFLGTCISSPQDGQDSPWPRTHRTSCSFLQFLNSRIISFEICSIFQSLRRTTSPLMMLVSELLKLFSQVPESWSSADSKSCKRCTALHSMGSVLLSCHQSQHHVMFNFFHLLQILKNASPKFFRLQKEELWIDAPFSASATDTIYLAIYYTLKNETISSRRNRKHEHV